MIKLTELFKVVDSPKLAENPCDYCCLSYVQCDYFYSEDGFNEPCILVDCALNGCTIDEAVKRKKVLRFNFSNIDLKNETYGL